MTSGPTWDRIGAVCKAVGNPRNTIGNVIRTCTGWGLASYNLPGIICAPVETWAAQWLTNQGTKVA